MKSECFLNLNLFYIFGILLSSKKLECNPITNSNFNEHVREFSLKEDNNSTNPKTLLKEGLGRYANFGPIGNPARIKIPDNSLAGSSHTRDFPQYNHHGYVRDHEEVPYYEYEHGYRVPTEVPGHHGFPQHSYDHEPYPVGYGHRHYNHALAAKAVLWPLAGIALLGAAAALVSNPILLQLGVAAGKRRRRDTIFTGPNIASTWSDNIQPNRLKTCKDGSSKKYTTSQKNGNTKRDGSTELTSPIDDSEENYIKIPTMNFN